MNRAELELRRSNADEAQKWAEEVIKRAQSDENLKVHSMRARVWLANAMIESGDCDNPLGEYSEALQIAEELGNTYLYQEILDKFTKQLRLVKDKNKEGLQQLCEGINAWRNRPVLYNQKLQSALENWFKEIEKLCSTSTSTT